MSSDKNQSEVVDFTNLTLAERTAAVDERIGVHQGRISSIEDLLKHTGKTIYIVVSPFGKSDEFDIGTCFIWEWEVGRVIDQYGVELTSSSELDVNPKNPAIQRRPILEHFTNKENIISLKDFNVIPNNYNNHAVFANQSEAEAYLMYRKVRFDEMKNLEKLNGEYPYWFTTKHVDKFVEMEEQVAGS